MKRSNIIILILILLVPAGLLMHNLSLRAAFQHAKAEPMRKYEGDQRYFRKLPPYHHIVLEGGVRTKSRKRRNGASPNNVQARIWVGNFSEPALEYRADMKPFLRTEVRNDTLYCWFEADNFGEWRRVARSYRELEIKVPGIVSITADSINLDIVQLVQRSPISVQYTNMTVANIGYTDLTRLNLNGLATYMHISGGKVDTLRYTLGDESQLTVGAGLVIGKKELVKAGEHARFSVIGVAADSAMVR
jgi:hypothetical protein